MAVLFGRLLAFHHQKPLHSGDNPSSKIEINERLLLLRLGHGWKIMKKIVSELCIHMSC
jgi:hypothetical protein